MTWAQDRRMEYIAQRLVRAGRVNRADLVGEFGISRATASGDLRDYQRKLPGAIRYDASVKAYVPRRVGPAHPAQRMTRDGMRDHGFSFMGHAVADMDEEEMLFVIFTQARMIQDFNAPHNHTLGAWKPAPRGRP